MQVKTGTAVLIQKRIAMSIRALERAAQAGKFREVVLLAFMAEAEAEAVAAMVAREAIVSLRITMAQAAAVEAATAAVAAMVGMYLILRAEVAEAAVTAPTEETQARLLV